ncbi:MAG: NADH-quinone oxidoreductase subunit L [Chlorobium sp.]|uniref:NADH-quinone oxidoreductase subunit L n=1 Tax=Chlorobium sp. TaxID=1095 RepID=UPI0025C19E00|nr:NADH-quinone oxidoreductase subunit L [Chlorobium sp.]MCF8216435.1 NADH-quinone oxidoreductase subunit L [Chlorobium sp.]MCF8271338.1 NADH-quinone oxidoreductase subunit L [Chlorobium sp.]MCF8287712.1 NADH-quinone oxidoreductase subunit L [Chlorobium sp.]MCF8291251.1 NADH-quinone oxidoreductase subunit L [Chlorobium sp.]MCF8385327.1 NADH-quinone oxidoreductase subunit L [Chlorobium sp.]
MHSLIQLSIAVLLLPLLSFVILIFFNKRLPGRGDFIGVGILGTTFALSLYIFWSVVVQAYDPAFRVAWDFTWIDFGDVPGVGPLQIKMGIVIDNLTAIMLAMVTLISFLVHLYSTGYMAGDKHYGRFFAYLGIFTFSMLGIVLSDNLFSIYIFWELVGLSSYLLIGFYFEKDSAADAQKKAFLANRVGDIGMWLGILILYSQFHTFNYQEIFQNLAAGKFGMSETWLTAAGILLFMGCIGKSAQFPLHVWLPDAMEGPTPVSALIHAATMVAAGVYFVARIFVLLTADALHVIAFIGAITAFMAATIAITQHDIKRVLAYSTVSQLGYMVLGLGVGAYSAALFHLVTHAFFKACLFLGSGAIIHAMHHEQDMRWMGGLRKNMPWTFATFTIATLALAGLPLTSGFLSKDAILAGAIGFANAEGGGIYYLIPFLGFFSAMLTAFYMGRQIWLVFFGESRTHLKPADDHHHGHDAHSSHGHDDHHQEAHGVHEVAWNMRAPLVVLAALSIFAVYSPDPLDGAKGWFMSMLPTPETVVGSSQGAADHATSSADFHASHLLAEAVPAGVHGAETDAHHEGVASETLHGEDAHGSAHGEGHGHEFADPRQAAIAHAAHEAHNPAIMISSLMVVLGISLALIVYVFRVIDPDKTARAIRPLYLFSFNKWYWDEIYQATFIKGSIVISKVFSWFDTNVVDGMVNGVGALTRKVGFASGGFDKYVVDGAVNFTAFFVNTTGAVLRKFQTGKVQTYVVFLMLAVIGYFIYYFTQLIY